jgi:hypothetical protein
MNPSSTQLLGWMPALTAFCLPVHPRLSAITLVIWSIVAAIHALSIAFRNEESSQRRALDPFVKWLAVGSMVCYCAMCLGMLWTENVAEGWFALEVKFSFFLLPLLFWQSNAMLDERWKYRAVQSFEWGLVGIFGLAIFSSILVAGHFAHALRWFRGAFSSLVHRPLSDQWNLVEFLL